MKTCVLFLKRKKKFVRNFVGTTDTIYVNYVPPRSLPYVLSRFVRPLDSTVFPIVSRYNSDAKICISFQYYCLISLNQKKSKEKVFLNFLLVLKIVQFLFPVFLVRKVRNHLKRRTKCRST